MRQLTFAGFMKRYVIALSESGSSGFYNLTREAATTNPRLREPLLIYAVATEREDILLAASRHFTLQSTYSSVLTQFRGKELLSALQNDDPALPDGYRKVWKSYQSVAMQGERDERVKELMRQKVLRIKTERGISTYKMCQDLRINNANVNTWLKHGTSAKVSIETARSILRYLEVK